MGSGGPARGERSCGARDAHACRGARCLLRPQERGVAGRSVEQICPQGRPSTGTAADPRRGQQVCRHPRDRSRGSLSTLALAPYLQQLHVACREPAAEPVLLLAFPPASVRDLQQRDKLTRGEAEPLAMPLPGEGVKGPAAGAGHGLGARAHSADCIPAEPRGLGSGSAGSQAPGAPGSRALSARRVWGARGSPVRQGTRDPRREADTRWLRRASGDAPGPGSLQIPAPGEGAGLRGRRPRGPGLRRQLPGDAERGLSPRGPAGARAALVRGNAQLPGEVGPGASPFRGTRRRAREGGAGRTWRGAGGRVAGRGLSGR